MSAQNKGSCFCHVKCLEMLQVQNNNTDILLIITKKIRIQNITKYIW